MSGKKPASESVTEPESSTIQTEREESNDKICELKLDTLQPFKGHPFKPYSGNRLEAMVESIRYNGLHNPIIVRPLPDGEKWEILSGHNRVKAFLELNKETIPARILENTSEETALLIVTETNLFQRSASDMSHSELALALSTHYEATKKQGSRNDLVQEIANMISDNDDLDTSGTVRQKSDSRKQVGAMYGMSERNVGYYIRINKLAKFHKERLDKGEIAKRTAVALSYLSEEEQRMIDEVLTSTRQRLFEKDAESLKGASKNRSLTRKKIEEILTKPEPIPVGLKFESRKLLKYFSPNQTPQEIEDELVKAIDLYREYHKSEEAHSEGPSGYTRVRPKRNENKTE